jgi:MraZ protein
MVISGEKWRFSPHIGLERLLFSQFKFYQHLSCMLIGEHTNSLGEKNRVALPKKFRDELGDELIITQGYEGCLIVVSPDKWAEITKEAASGPFVSLSVRETTRFLLGGATEIELDKQGRFVLPQNLLTYAGINAKEKEVVFLGLGRWVEIWSEPKWQERKAYLAKEGSAIAEKLSEIKIS